MQISFIVDNEVEFDEIGSRGAGVIDVENKQHDGAEQRKSS